MKCFVLSVLVLLAQINAANAFELTEIQTLSCQVTLCLSAGSAPKECNPFLKIFDDMEGPEQEWLLKLCPNSEEGGLGSGENEEGRELTDAERERAGGGSRLRLGEEYVGTGQNHQMLWKPISEGNHNLVVLLPATTRAYRVTLYDSEGNKIEEGDYNGRTNGRRPTYRFNLPGHGYPDPTYMQVKDSVFIVHNPGGRHEELELVEAIPSDPKPPEEGEEGNS